jgi:hypothetical protein
VLTLVEVTNSRSNTLRFPVTDSSGGYSVRSIQGLGPVDAALTSSSIAQADGASPQNARRDVRNLLFKLGLEPDYSSNTVESLRSDLYDYFLPKTNIQVAIYLDDVLFAVTQGQVETCQNEMFSDDPEVDVSIICYDPDLYAPAQQVLSANTTSGTDFQTISYPGSTETGVIFTLNVNRIMSSFALYNTTPDNKTQVVQVNGSFAPGDIVTITSIVRQKSVKLTRSGITTSVLFYRDSSSDWITLQKGDNHFRAFASGAAIPYTVAYTPKYGAI